MTTPEQAIAAHLAHIDDAILPARSLALTDESAAMVEAAMLGQSGAVAWGSGVLAGDIRTHARLLAASPGYAAFYAEAEDDDDREMIISFAGWLIIPGDDLDPHDKWTAERFRAEWDHWNS